MAFKMKTTKGDYTTTLADKIISQKQPIYSLSTEPVSYTHLDVYKRQQQRHPHCDHP